MFHALAMIVAGVAIAANASFAGKSADEWIVLLADDDENVRRQAAYALGEIGPPAAHAVPQLAGALSDRFMETRWYAAAALGRMGTRAEQAVPALIEALGDPQNDKVVRRHAARSLGRIGKPARPAAGVLEELVIDGDGATQVAAALALWQIDRRQSAIENLVALLSETNGDTAYEAATALAEIAPDDEVPVGPVIRALSHPDSDIRRAAAKLAARIGTPAVVPLVAALESPADVDCAPALAALKIIVDDLRRRRLYDAGTTEEEFQALVRTLSTRVVPPVLKQLASDDPSVQIAAAHVLAAMGPIAVPGLLQMMRRGDVRGQQAAVEAMVLVESNLPPDGAKLPGLAWLNQSLAGPLKETLGDENRIVRAAAIRAIANLALGPWVKDAEPQLRRALKDDDVAVRRYAAAVLQQIAESDEVDDAASR